MAPSVAGNAWNQALTVIVQTLTIQLPQGGRLVRNLLDRMLSPVYLYCLGRLLTMHSV
jgi:hypothetical protein